MKRAPLNQLNHASRQKAFLEQNEERLAELVKFNQGVSTRQVRRQYARVMAKRDRELGL